MPRCLALLSGGLDSMLAIRLMQEQGIEVEAINFKTVFTCCQDDSSKAAHELGVRLTILPAEDDYFDLVRKPLFGYGKGVNPCIDCRIYMFERVARMLESMQAQFVISGEVLGQRPKSQKRRDLEIIEAQSDLEGRLLRPLSAKLLPITLPEREGLVDRERLYSFTGQSRKGLIELAKRLGLKSIPVPSNGCALTEIGFSAKVFDLIKRPQAVDRWDYELLSVGRHFRISDRAKLIVARNETDGERLRLAFREASAREVLLLEPNDFVAGPALLVGPSTSKCVETSIGLVARYARKGSPNQDYRVRVRSSVEETDRMLPASVTEEILSIAPVTAESR